MRNHTKIFRLPPNLVFPSLYQSRNARALYEDNGCKHPQKARTQEMMVKYNKQDKLCRSKNIGTQRKTQGMFKKTGVQIIQIYFINQ